MRNPLAAWRSTRDPSSPSDGGTGLPIRRITVGDGDEQLAVHVTGNFSDGRAALICIPGYVRNMADFAAFLPLIRRSLGADWPLVVVDLRGRGRSPSRRRAGDYTSLADARDVSMVARALGIEEAVIFGEGHGGQVAMAIAMERPGLIAATILLDAGPAIAPQGLVRLRNNAEAIDGLRGVTGLTLMLRRMTAADYPAATPEELDALAARTHRIEESGRATALFDGKLIENLHGFAHDDVMAPQWALFDLLKHRPLLLIRSQFTDQLTPQLFAEMQQRRPDALAMEFAGQGSPNQLNQAGEVAAVAEFARQAGSAARQSTRRAHVE